MVFGYAGGRVPDPSYEMVCTGLTGRAEVVQVTFDPSSVTYRELLELFFVFHDPATLNRQGNDAGTQFRCAIYRFYPAEEYHQQYFRRNSTRMYCQAVVVPKGAKLRDEYAGKLNQVS